MRTHLQNIILNNQGLSQIQAKATFLHQTQERHKFINSNALLLISIGQMIYEGPKLAAVIKLVSENFLTCDIAVCDVLQRHTMQINDFSSIENIYEKSKLLGESWINRNQESLNSLKIPGVTFRWEKYLLNQDFSILKEQVIAAYKQEESFKQAMNDTIGEFIKRYERRLITIDKERAFNCCFNYLVEESTIIMLMLKECRYNYIVHPGEMPKILHAAREKFVVPYDSELLKWATIYVRSRTNRFEC